MLITKRNHITVYGEGAHTIVFAHGFGCNQKMWESLMPYFCTYRVVLFDYVGSGYSDINSYDTHKYNTLDGYKQDVLDVLQEIDANNVTFVGHSVSGMIGLLAAIEAPHYFKRLIMIGASARYLNDEGYNGGFEKQDIEELLQLMEMNIAGWANVMASFATDSENFPAVTTNIEQTFSLLNPIIARQFAEVTFFSDNRDKLSACTIPTYLVQCAEDSIVPIEAANYLQQHIPNSHMQIVDIKGHYPHLSHPEAISELVKGYMEEEVQA